VELDAGDYRRGGLSLTQVNKVHHVHTIARVAAMLGEDEDWLPRAGEIRSALLKMPRYELCEI
jgi:hypothetical protein